MTIPLKGGRELSEFLRAFPERLQKNAVRSGLRAGAKPIRDQARQNAPKKSGRMAKSIKTGSPRVDRDGVARITIRLRGDNAFIGLFIEYGVAAHVIKAGDSNRSRRLLDRQFQAEGASSDLATGKLKIGNNLISGAVLHPGIQAKPFMRPAFEARAQDAINAFGSRIQEFLSSRTGFTSPLLEVDEAA